jgi:hypothetical protein
MRTAHDRFKQKIDQSIEGQSSEKKIRFFTFLLIQNPKYKFNISLPLIHFASFRVFRG